MGRFRVFAVVAAAATVVGLASAPIGQAAATAPRHRAPAADTSLSSRAAVQWTTGRDGKVTGLVHYSGGTIAHLAKRDPAAPGKFSAAFRAAVRTAAAPSRPDRTPQQVPAADQGTIKGRVTDSAHDPLAGVEIDAYAGPSDEPLATTSTNANGHYSLTLPAGEYFFEFDASAATGGNSDATGYIGTGTQLEVTAGNSVIRNARLRAGALLRVRVTDHAGHPLAGVGPYVQPITPYVQSLTDGGFFLFGFGGSGLTGADGTFTFRGLPADAVLVCFAASGGSPTGGDHDALGYRDRCSRRPVAPAAGSSSHFPTVRLGDAPGGALAGVVRSGAGAPIAGVDVLVDGATEGETAITAGDGSYRFTGLPPGSYRVCADAVEAADAPRYGHSPGCHPGRVEVRRGAVRRADITLHLGGAITGRITGPTGAPVQGAAVFASDSGRQPGYAFTGADGRYRIKGLPTGQYRVCVDPSGAVDPDSPTGDRVGCYQHKTPVPVRAGSTHEHIDVQLRLGGAIAGRITDAHGGVADVEIDVASLPNFTGGGFAVTDANGDYRITGLTPGSYEACISTFDLSGGGTEKCTADPVAVRAGETSALDESLAPPASRGSIAVTVRDEQGRKVQGVDVVVLKPCARPDPFGCASEPLFGHHGKAAIVASQVVDTSGRTEIDGRKPGVFAVCLFSYYGVTSDGAPPTGYTDRCAGRTYTVAVASGATTRVHLTLHPGGRVEGRVTDVDGHPLAHAHVHVSHAAPTDYLDPFADFPFDIPGLQSPAADAETNKDGAYSIRGVRPGAQKVCVSFPPDSIYLDRCAAARADVAADATAHRPDLRIRRAGAISGVVRDAAGRPLSLAAVAVLTTGPRARFVDEVFVHADGHYRSGGLPAGRYLVCFAAPHRSTECYRNVIWHIRRHPNPPAGATPVRVRTGRTTTGIGARLPLAGRRAATSRYPWAVASTPAISRSAVAATSGD